jgi:SET domain-containing protein
MILDIVATRDIEPDEEVFIDYGRSALWFLVANNDITH